MSKEIERSWYIRDVKTDGLIAKQSQAEIGRVRVANSPENALRRYLNDCYSVLQRNGRGTPFVPKKSYEVFLLSDPIEIEVTPIIESPFTLKILF